VSSGLEWHPDRHIHNHDDLRRPNSEPLHHADYDSDGDCHYNGNCHGDGDGDGTANGDGDGTADHNAGTRSEGDEDQTVGA
jgi:hypothetical protein